jgi:hypothetical protein
LAWSLFAAIFTLLGPRNWLLSWKPMSWQFYLHKWL